MDISEKMERISGLVRIESNYGQQTDVGLGISEGCG